LASVSTRGAKDVAGLKISPDWFEALQPDAPLREALAAGRFEELGDGRFRAAGHELGPDDVLVERRGKEGWAVASEDGVTVALDTTLDAELELEGRVHDLVHAVNTLRREQGLEVTDRIALTLPDSDRDLLVHEEWIARDVLAVSVEIDPDADSPSVARVA
jgi:hypothetical protein